MLSFVLHHRGARCIRRPCGSSLDCLAGAACSRFFHRYDDRPRLWKNAVPEAAFVSAPRYVHRTQSLLTTGCRGASNIGSINVHEITQLGIGARHLPADEVGRASRDESQAISFINAGSNRLASLEVCGHLRRERSRTTRSAPAWWTTAAPAF